jgi:hypothetical protein
MKKDGTSSFASDKVPARSIIASAFAHEASEFGEETILSRIFVGTLDYEFLQEYFGSDGIRKNIFSRDGWNIEDVAKMPEGATCRDVKTNLLSALNRHDTRSIHDIISYLPCEEKGKTEIDIPREMTSAVLDSIFTSYEAFEAKLLIVIDHICERVRSKYLQAIEDQCNAEIMSRSATSTKKPVTPRKFSLKRGNGRSFRQ